MEELWKRMLSLHDELASLKKCQNGEVLPDWAALGGDDFKSIAARG